MILLGAHVSIAGGYHKAVEKGGRLGLSVIQIFPKNQLQWASKELEKQEIQSYFQSLKEYTQIKLVFAHGSYLYNFASPDDKLITQSKYCILNELDLCSALCLPYLIIHPGSHMGSSESKGIERIIQSLKHVLENDHGTTAICIETTAGQGTGLGYKFEHLRDIIQGVGPDRIGACIDTCHIFAAGYDIRTLNSYRRVIDEFDRIVGLSYLKVVHLNDSKGELGSRIDRHMHIGHGVIGKESFKYIMRDQRFLDIPKVIETPKTQNGKEMDRVNIEVLRSFVKNH
jgi:deoxyribonuclease-4